jgi:predicted SAM-dependent methyltransferase
MEIKQSQIYLQYGAGYAGPTSWVNYDAHPMIILEKIPFVKSIVKKRGKFAFAKNIKYGNIVKGFKAYENRCEAVYCSHVLEHLTFEEFQIAIQNTHKLLKKGGIFRLVMPDLEDMCKQYLEHKNDPNRAINFVRNSGLGYEKKGLRHRVKQMVMYSSHLWLWDYQSTEKILKEIGFKTVRRCEYHDSKLKAFEEVENIDRFRNAIAIEAVK